MRHSRLLVELSVARLALTHAAAASVEAVFPGARFTGWAFGVYLTISLGLFTPALLVSKSNNN